MSRVQVDADVPRMLPRCSLQSSSATATGFGAILLWSSLATLTVAAGSVPPFELTALTFAVGGVLGLVVSSIRGGRRLLWPPFPVLCLGVAGLFGDYVLYFAALRLAPPPQAALIVALWPLLMALLANLVLGERMRAKHIVGTIAGTAGVVVLTTGTLAPAAFDLRYAWGYALALAAALVWAGYSVLSRRHADVPTEAMTGTCLAAALLAGICHAACEPTVLPSGAHQILAILAIGLGPAGGAFFLWDHGMKRGSIRMLAILAYAIPVISMVLLVATGFAVPSVALAVSCVLILAAGACASYPANWLNRRPRRTLALRAER